VRFTPHDFRRLFTTELVGAGLPLHIAASLLGHLSLDTTRGYTAVFPEHLTGYALRWALQLAFLRAQQRPTPPQRGSAAPGSSPGRLRDPT